MKNKKLVYPLLAVALLVWSIIVYKVYNKLTESATTSEYSQKIILNSTGPDKTVLDTFSLSQEFNDPFSTSIKEDIDGDTLKSASTIKPVFNTAPKIKKEEAFNGYKWPDITYIGKVKNQLSGNEVGLFNISGKNFMIAKGCKVKDIELIALSSDSVKIEYNNEKRTLKLKKAFSELKAQQ